jgi:hypothetical protein
LRIVLITLTKLKIHKELSNIAESLKSVILWSQNCNLFEDLQKEMLDILKKTPQLNDKISEKLQ